MLDASSRPVPVHRTSVLFRRTRSTFRFWVWWRRSGNPCDPASLWVAWWSSGWRRRGLKRWWEGPPPWHRVPGRSPAEAGRRFWHRGSSAEPPRSWPPGNRGPPAPRTSSGPARCTERRSRTDLLQETRTTWVQNHRSPEPHRQNHRSPEPHRQNHRRLLGSKENIRTRLDLTFRVQYVLRMTLSYWHVWSNIWEKIKSDSRWLPQLKPSLPPSSRCGGSWELLPVHSVKANMKFLSALILFQVLK